MPKYKFIGGPIDGELLEIDHKQQQVEITDHGATNNLVPSGIQTEVYKDKYIYHKKTFHGVRVFKLAII